MGRARWLRRTIVTIVGVIVIAPAVVLLASRAAAWRRETQTRAAAAPKTGRFVRAADVDMFVQEAGPPDGPPVLLVHGTGAWSEIWRRTIDTLAARGYHAVAVDMPPFGYSSRPESADYGDDAQARRILGVIDALGLEQVTLVGHSFGGRPTMQAFFLDPSRVARLVLVDAALGLDTTKVAARAAWPIRATLSVPSLRNGVVAATLTNPAFTSRLLRGLVADTTAVTPARIAMFQRPFVIERTTASFGEWLRPFMTTNEQSLATERSRYASIAVPTLVIWGDLDSVTPIGQGRDLARLLHASSWAELAGVGHIPAIEAPERFNAALLAFLDLNR
jgi:pimeloyl-ACP methyl ester carboxylesterase